MCLLFLFAMPLFSIPAQAQARADVTQDLASVSIRAQDDPVMHVSSVADLYAAVNDPDNAGRRIVIEPGIYPLDPTQPNGGRLELQQDMDLVGQHGDVDAVVIDASNLPPASYALSSFKTGPIRMGRGSNALEWLTIQNAHAAVAAVESDLLGPGATVVRVAHIVAQGNAGGIDFRNVGGSMGGRVLHGVAEDNVTRENTAVNGFGIRMINSNGVAAATVWVTLRRNHSYGNLRGMIAVNLNSSSNTILIESRADRFTNNAVGCALEGGGSSGQVADSNVLVFESNGDVIADNDGITDPQHPYSWGITAFGGVSIADQPNRTSANVLRLALVNTTFSGNRADSDVTAFGANGLNSIVPGTNNHMTILLKGVSRDAALSIVDSDPPDPSGTNTVLVLRHGRQ